MAPCASKYTPKHSTVLLGLLSTHERAHNASSWLGIITLAVVFGSNSLQDDVSVKLHDDALVDKLVYDQDHASHVVDEALPLYIMFEHLIEALVNSVKNRSQNQLVVLLAVSKHVDSHVGVASEYSHVVINIHDVIFIHVQLGGGRSILLVRLCEQGALKHLLLSISLQTQI